MDIIDKINRIVSEEIKAKRSPADRKQYADKYFRLNKKKMQMKKKKLDASAEGKIRKRMKPIMKKSRQTPTGRHKRENNV